MKKRFHTSVFTATGIPSLFLIFSVLVLVILSLLTLNTSRADLQTSRLSLSQTTAYYEACSQMTDICRAAGEFLYDELESASGKEAWLDRAGDFFEKTEHASWDEERDTAVIEIPFSETQALRAELFVFYPEAPANARASCIRIQSWNTVSAGTWEPDTSQPVFKGEL